MEDVYWTFSYSPAYGDDGKVQGAFVTCTETTGKVNTKKALEETAKQMRSIVENVPFPIGVYMGSELKIELANQAILDIWKKGNNVLGKSYKKLLPELENQEVFRQLDEVYRTGIPFHAKNQRIDFNSRDKLQPNYFNYSFTPLLDTAGIVYGILSTAADVTEVNLAAIKILESEQNLRNTILQAPVAMCIFRGESHVVELANEKMFELWGKPAESVLNKPIFEGLPEARDQGFEAILDNVYRNGKSFSAEGVSVSLPRNQAVETIYVNFVFEAYRERDGVISGIIALAVDVTAQVIARREIEHVVTARTKELAEANHDLQRSNAELAQFAYIASHDLQEPLRKISTFSQMLGKKINNTIDDQSKSYINKITNAALRMNTLVRDVLKYSELVKKNDVFESVDLNEVTAGIINDFELLIEQKGALVEYDQLPVIDAIPLQMSQLFSNLIGNALKFTRPDVKPLIVIKALKFVPGDIALSAFNQSTEYFKIIFSDNGIGFKDEYKDQIFNIFQRLHRKSDFEGTGIGLAMCKKIVLNHQGDLNASGSSENGAVFNVILPLKHTS